LSHPFLAESSSPSPFGTIQPLHITRTT
jgi:hypothetical protein